MKLKKRFDKEELNDRKVITIRDANISTKEIEKNDKITFIVCNTDENALEKIISSIVELKKEYKDKDFSVFISSSYKKLHRFTKGAL